ncbi:probable inactive leucine-rich repeat receptor-like protein kinase At3g03770 isoform X3 [Arachis hypogaea]|uniref:probable inactive leucine-rich repeat receptor-like protein kinase At3g03770 isoform X3 n=1 Tax=Arachis hypogaea TaxID=3818 RepID=UPI0010FC5A2E|nr:probable inactive leucine-rich repeat receptor-like protein kinase At3g03770 isoform X3 [Arachis hypogaea]
MGSFQDLVLVLLCSVWCVFHAVNCNAQLQSSQTLVLLQLKKHLEYPKPLDIWKDRWTNLCSSTQQVNVSCNENFVTELLIIGDKTQSKFREEHEGFDGYAIQDQTLSQGFSMDSFVATLARLTNLRVLKLVSLGIWGPLPDRIHRLYDLQHLDLSSNFLYGSIPPKISTMVNLQTLNLGDNFFNGTIPTLFFNSSSNLSYLSLKNNKLKGHFPNSILGINTLNEIDISNNNISGGLQDFNGLSNLEHLDLSWNNLDSTLPPMPKGLKNLFLSRNSFSGYVSEAAKFGREDLPLCRSYSLEELKEATNNFDNPNFMGENLYGKLYRGKLESGMQVVIRCLPLSKKYTIRNFKLRLDLLAKLRHPHLVSLLGHCIDGVIGDQSDTNVFLVYEFVSNGSFQTYLSEDSGGKVYNWSERLSVLISIAKAIHFLHTGMIPGFFKNRLKTNNILINEHWMAKLSDYGLSIISEETDACGVNGESPDSMQMKRLEDDVYSFGFIILEALVGPSLSAKREALMLHERGSFNSQDGWKQIVDPIVMSTCSKESLSIVISISNKCISPESWSRPSIEDVLWNLQYASQVQATADGV